MESDVKPVIVIATVTPHAGQERTVTEALLKTVTFARLEPGCQCCELHRDDGGAPRLVMVERWSCSDDLYAHEKSAVSQALMADIAGIADLDVLRLERLA